MKEPILSVKNLTTHLMIGDIAYPVVDNFSFDLHLGKTLAVVGESGCGKSMLALSLMQILSEPPCLKPQGEVLYKGQNLLDLSEKEMQLIRGAKIAMIFQDPSTSLNPVYTIGNQLLETLEIHQGLVGKEAEEKVIQALTEVKIPNPKDRMNDYPHQLSGGMKQRVMIAGALMCEPDILIADEPTTALDVTIQKQVLDLIRDLQKKMGMAVLLITHDMGIVAEVADEVIVMYTSQAIEVGSVFDIFDGMSHPYTMGLFASRPSVRSKRGELNPIKGAVPPLDNYTKGCRFNTRCTYVMPKCKNDVPNFKIGESKKHFAKCWLCEK